jgi:acetyltransferase-like isoleucine patch superfamily enzyme
VDPGVVLGYRAARAVKSPRLAIGRDAQIRSGTVVYEGSTIGDGLETGHHVVIREENVIGDGLRVWNHSTVDYGCRIGQNVRIHCNVYVCQYTVIEDDAFLAPGVITTNDPHPVCTRCMRGPVIGKGARIGAAAVLGPGVRIGAHALVGAGSVVVRDVAPYAVVRGNPARKTGTIFTLRCAAGKRKRPYAEIRPPRRRRAKP